MQTILAIDDEEGVRQSYKQVLSKDYRLFLAGCGRTGLGTLAEKNVDLILLDLTMPGMSGMEVLVALAELRDSTPVIVVTASNTVTSAVDAMKLGARDYIIKPFDVDALLRTVERVLGEDRERRELNVLREENFSDFESMIGDSTAFQRVLAAARQAMRVNSTVLITGESGTGKDVLARAIHSGGKRAEKPFIQVSCCAIPEQLFESELFGHEKGAFTGADQSRVGKIQIADEGTFFLDEIGEMPVDMQTKLLRVLQDSRFYPIGSHKEVEVDIRVVCATNRDLLKAVQEGRFREDLYYRINVLHIEMPPLRQRREDIPSLVAHFVAKHGPCVDARVEGICPKAMGRIAAYQWPGNVRELENFVERLLVYHGEEAEIAVEHVTELLPESREDAGVTLIDFEGLPLEEARNKMDRYLIKRALMRSGNVQSKASELLGTTRRILKYKMDQLNISA